MKTTTADAATHPALVEERKRVLASRLLAAQSVPVRVCNATSKDFYTGPVFGTARPGADAFLEVKSRGWV